jgi:hypothetical protein
MSDEMDIANEAFDRDFRPAPEVTPAEPAGDYEPQPQDEHGDYYEPEGWAGPSQEEWEQTMAFVQGLAPLAELIQQVQQDPSLLDELDEYDVEPTYDGSYNDYLRTVIRGQIDDQLGPLHEWAAVQSERDARQQAEEEAQSQAAEEMEYVQARKNADELIERVAKAAGMRNVDRNRVLGEVLGQLRAFETAARSAGYKEEEIQRVIGSRQVAEMLAAEAVEQIRIRNLTDRMLDKV